MYKILVEALYLILMYTSIATQLVGRVQVAVSFHHREMDIFPSFALWDRP